MHFDVIGGVVQLLHHDGAVGGVTEMDISFLRVKGFVQVSGEFVYDSGELVFVQSAQ